MYQVLHAALCEGISKCVALLYGEFGGLVPHRLLGCAMQPDCLGIGTPGLGSPPRVQLLQRGRVVRVPAWLVQIRLRESVWCLVLLLSVNSILRSMHATAAMLLPVWGSATLPASSP